MNFRTFVAPAFALALALGSTPQAKAEVTPAEHVVAAMAISRCAMEYGHTEEQGRMIFATSVSRLNPDAVINIMKNPTFNPRVANHIDAAGGCKVITDVLYEAVDEELKSRGVSND